MLGKNLGKSSNCRLDCKLEEDQLSKFDEQFGNALPKISVYLLPKFCKGLCTFLLIDKKNLRKNKSNLCMQFMKSFIYAITCNEKICYGTRGKLLLLQTEKTAPIHRYPPPTGQRSDAVSDI